LNKRRNQLSLAFVTFVLGMLVVVQLRAQAASNGLDQLAPTELTVLVGNLNTRNDQLRAEIATTQAELSTLQASDARGDTSLGQLQSDLARVRAWTGLDPVTGPGVRITVTGPLDAASVGDLVNELRNAGAEAFQVGDVRIGVDSAFTGSSGAITLDGTALTAPYTISAIGDPPTLAAALAIPGGVFDTVRRAGGSMEVAQSDALVIDALRPQRTPLYARPAQ